MQLQLGKEQQGSAEKGEWRLSLCRLASQVRPPQDQVALQFTGP